MKHNIEYQEYLDETRRSNWEGLAEEVPFGGNKRQESVEEASLSDDNMSFNRGENQKNAEEKAEEWIDVVEIVPLEARRKSVFEKIKKREERRKAWLKVGVLTLAVAIAMGASYKVGENMGEAKVREEVRLEQAAARRKSQEASRSKYALTPGPDVTPTPGPDVTPTPGPDVTPTPELMSEDTHVGNPGEHEQLGETEYVSLGEDEEIVTGQEGVPDEVWQASDATSRPTSNPVSMPQPSPDE